VLLTGLASICAGLLCLAGFVTCTARAENRRPDLSPATELPLSRPARMWLAATVVLVVTGVGSLCGHVLQVWGLFSG
jgi:hypothetical protein